MNLPLTSLGLLLLAAPLAAQTAKSSPPPQSPAAPDLRRIGDMIEKGQLGPAEQRLRRILAQGGDARARDLLGLVLAKQGKLEDAERQFQSALATNPALLPARQHLARLYLDQKKQAAAAAELRRAAQQGPLERDLALTLAGIELSEGRSAPAALQLRSVAERFQSVQALLQLARLQSSQRDATGALESLRRARMIAPNSEEVLGAFAQVALAVHAPVPAILALEPLTRMCPTVAQYHYLLGVALMLAGDMPAAVEALQRAEQLEPNRSLTLVALGLALNNRKLYGEAKPFLLRCLEREPDNVEALAALAESEDGLGELSSAEGHAERALAKAGGNATANLVTGLVLMKQERYAEARAAFEKAAAADPASPKAQYQLSLACARLNDEAGSQRHLAEYQQKLREIEDRVKQIRLQTGLSGGGMQP